jgi:hypothetical protein
MQYYAVKPRNVIPWRYVITGPLQPNYYWWFARGSPLLAAAAPSNSPTLVISWHFIRYSYVFNSAKLFKWPFRPKAMSRPACSVGTSLVPCNRRVLEKSNNQLQKSNNPSTKPHYGTWCIASCSLHLTSLCFSQILIYRRWIRNI